MSRGAGRPPVVGVVILTVDQKEQTLRCLRSFRSVDRPSHRIVLWDNGSADGTGAAVREAHPEVLLHRHPVNAGAAAGRNGGARLAIEAFGPPYLLFIDNDTEVTPGFLEALLAPIEADSTVGQTVPKIRFLHARERLNSAGGAELRFWSGRSRGIGYGEIDRGQYDTSRECVAGGCTLVRTGVFESLEGFDTRYDPFGYEDMDFCLRLREAGHRCLYVPEAVIYHEETQTFGAGEYTGAYARLKARNWILFLRRHAPLWQQAIFFGLVAPLRLLRTVVREARRGNLTAGGALLTGALDHWRDKKSRTDG